MDKYLLEILKNVNTIIIPGLGALTIINAAKGEIMFMPYLKHDDGKLSAYIAENEGWEEIEAKNLIAKYVREIQQQLAKGESYDMFEFGSFFKNSDGDVEFKNWEAGASSAVMEVVVPEAEVQAEEKVEVITLKEEPTAEPTKVEEQSPQPVAEEPKKEKSKKEEKPKKKKEAVEASVAPATELPKEEIKEEIVEEVKSSPKVASTVHVVAETQPEPKPEPTIIEKKEIQKAEEKIEKLKKDQKVKTEKKRKKRGAGFWILLVLFMLLVASGTYFGLNYNQLKQHIPFLADKTEVTKDSDKKKEMEEMLSEPEDTNEEPSNEETSEVESEEPEIIEDPVEEIKPPVVTNSGGGAFHVIAGAFSSAGNAERYGEKMKAQGYQVKVGQGRGMNLVSIKSFATRAEAEAALPELKGVAPNAWVFEWN